MQITTTPQHSLCLKPQTYRSRRSSPAHIFAEQPREPVCGGLMRPLLTFEKQAPFGRASKKMSKPQSQSGKCG